MSRTTTRVAAGTAIATAGLFWTVPLLNTLAVADNAISPGGVPCISIIQQAITNPPNLTEALPGAASSIFSPGSPTIGGPVPPASAVGSVPIPPASLPGAPGAGGMGGVVIPPASVPCRPVAWWPVCPHRRRRFRGHQLPRKCRSPRARRLPSRRRAWVALTRPPGLWAAALSVPDSMALRRSRLPADRLRACPQRWSPMPVPLCRPRLPRFPVKW